MEHFQIFTWMIFLLKISILIFIARIFRIKGMELSCIQFCSIYNEYFTLHVFEHVDQYHTQKIKVLTLKPTLAMRNYHFSTICKILAQNKSQT